MPAAEPRVHAHLDCAADCDILSQYTASKRNTSVWSLGRIRIGHLGSEPIVLPEAVRVRVMIIVNITDIKMTMTVMLMMMF